MLYRIIVIVDLDKLQMLLCPRPVVPAQTMSAKHSQTSLKLVFKPVFVGSLSCFKLPPNSCNAEDGSPTNVQENKSLNETQLLNNTKPEKEETPSDENIIEEDPPENGFILPTVAPATPHSEKYPSVIEEQASFGTDDNSSLKIKQNGRETNGHGSKSESRQVDEVKFDNLIVNKISLNVDEPQNDSFSKTEERKEGEEVKDDKETKEKEQNADESVADNKYALKLESEDLMKIAARTEKSTEEMMKLGKEEKEVPKSSELEETESSGKDVGILESFKDWKEKQESNEKKSEHEKPASQVLPRKRFNKKTNYASSECGAKVVATNGEAQNTAAILSENKDLYMLSPCSSNIWFVVELCEKVQVEAVDIASFELFSSTPESFKVYVGSRFPTREWRLVGSFVARSERVIQSFDLQEKSYAKFVKIEMVSHFGKEHYCPLSLVRIFGRSEVEELEDSEADHSDPDHRDSVDSIESDGKLGKDTATTGSGNNNDSTKDPSNFLKSATDVVIGLVNKATETFTGKTDKSNQTEAELNGKEAELASNLQADVDGSKHTSNGIEVGGSGNDVASNETDATGNDAENTAANGTRVEVRNNSTSDLVVLLEGDDTDDDSVDSNFTQRKCVFDGEIQGDRCANPCSFFWIPYLFKLRMCPSAYHDNQSHARIKIADFNDVIGSSSSTGADSTEFSSVDPNGVDDGYDAGNRHFVSSTSFVAKPNATEAKVEEVTVGVTTAGLTGSVTEIKRESFSESTTDNISMMTSASSSVVTAVSSVAEENSGIAGEASVVTSSRTELQRQVTSDIESSSCGAKPITHPDLSQLVDTTLASTSSDDKAAKEDTFKQPVSMQVVEKSEDDVIKNDTANESTGSERRSGEDEAIVTAGDVDVLITSIDEKLGEGKAEIPGKIAEDGVSSGAEELTKKSLDDVSQKGAEKGLLNRPDEVLNKTKYSSGENASRSVSDSQSLQAQSNASAAIEPSFSQPAMSSLGSSKTSEDSLSVTVISYELTENQTLLKQNADSSIDPASISESTTSQYSVIKATRISEQGNVVEPSERSAQEHMQDGKEGEKQVYRTDNVVKTISAGSKRTVDSTVQPNNGVAESNGKAAAQESAVTIGSGSSGNNKESAILKLKNRVKALETNLSLSTLYLEEMSKRYRTALEDQQKQFKLKLNALNLSVFEDKQLIKQQQKNIEELTKQLMLLTIQFRNFTQFTEEQQRKTAERYIFSCTIEAVIIIILLWNCMTRSRSRSSEHRETRRHSAPSSMGKHIEPDGMYLAITSGDDMQTKKRNNSPPKYQFEPNLTPPLPVSKRKRQRRKKIQTVDDAVFNNQDESPSRCDVVVARETTIMNRTAGVLFSAGRGIISGLAGAFTKQKKTIGSRQTRALVDSNVYDSVGPFSRSKSLGTIEEDGDFHVPLRHKSFESNLSNKAVCTGLQQDKRRG
eukprot:gene5046-5703_t